MKCIKLIIILLLLTQVGYSKNLILDYENDYPNYIKGSTTITDLERQLKIDSVIQKEIEENFIYTDLKECLKLAMSENYDIKINKKKREEKLWNSRNAKVQTLPDLHYDYTWQRLRGEFLVGGIVPITVKEITMNSYFNIEWSLFDKGLYFFNIIITGNELKSAKAKVKYSVDEALYKTSIAYYDTLESKLKIDAFRTNLNELNAYKEMTEKRYAAGIDKKYDVKRAEADFEKAKNDYSNSLDTLRLKQAALAAIIGVEVLEPLYPYEATITPKKLLKKDYSVDELYFIATELREDIKEKKAQIKADIAKKNSMISDVLPDIKFTYQDGYAGTKSSGMYSNTTVKINATMYLGDKLLAGTITKMKAENALIESKKLELEKLKREIKTKILEAYLNSSDSMGSINAAQKELEAAEESLRLAVGSYKAGKSTFTDILDAQTIKTEAKLNLISKIIKYNKAQIQLLFESGLITLSAILQDYETKS